MKDKNINIEKVLSELESIVNKMEEDNLNLEDSLSSYEKGILLVKTAQENLKPMQVFGTMGRQRQLSSP